MYKRMIGDSNIENKPFIQKLLIKSLNILGRNFQKYHCFICKKAILRDQEDKRFKP